tara:strand:+ start:170 stop:778 length:609 start_codon:yes stop_codon:yes gene_type:complete
VICPIKKKGGRERSGGWTLRYVDNIFQIKNILPSKYFLEICDEFWAWGNEWRFTKNEEFNENHPNRGCLNKPKFGDSTLGDNLLLIKYGSYLKYICQRYVKKNLSLTRINTNIQFFGQESNFHIDGLEGSWTLNLFASNNWNTEWGGEFVIQDKDGDYFYYPYIPNNAILFPGYLEHMGHAPNVLGKHPRFTVAFTYQELTT